MLPDKPSELIRVALKDLRSVENDNTYIVNMGTWHSPNDMHRVCEVCLAGAVMAKTLDVDPTWWVTPTSMSEQCFKLMALDHFRLGYVTDALNYLDVQHDTSLDREIINYEVDPDQFHQEMEELAQDLEDRGL